MLVLKHWGVYNEHMDATISTRSLPLEAFAFEYDTLDQAGKVTERYQGEGQKFIELIRGNLPLEMIALPGGTFQMGAVHGQGFEDETPRHLVSLAPFLIARTPVTQAQWQAVMGKPAKGRFDGADLPVENISWGDAQTFCKRLSRLTGRAYHLPSEAQWEYACRAGTSTPFYTGDTITTDYANYCGEHTFRDEAKGLYRHKTTPASLLPPNPYGLLDMLGNVWEFCADGWHPDYSGAPFDGSSWVWGAEKGFRVTRGGSWHEPPSNCRCATRLRVSEKEHDDYYGFRVAL